MNLSIKKIVRVSGQSIGKAVSTLLKYGTIMNAYNYVFERSPRLLVKTFVRYVGLPQRDLLWTILLKNGRKVKTIVHQNNAKTSQFALSYQWHSPSLNFTEKLLLDNSDQHHVWIDVGANLGIRSLLPLSEGRTVFMIEPNKELNELNRERCALNGFETFEIIEIGVSDKKGTAEFYIDETSYNSSLHASILETNVLNRKEIIELDSLDNIFSKITESPACIKIDVEGHELQVLRGAESLIKQWYPPIIIEVNTNSENYPVFKDVMKNFGYSLYQIYSYGSEKYFNKIDMDQWASADQIRSNDFLAISDRRLETIVGKYCN